MIRVTLSNGLEYLINPDHIIRVEPIVNDAEPQSEIHLTDGKVLGVIEDFNQLQGLAASVRRLSSK